MTAIFTMKNLTSIVAVSTEGAIGCRNELPWKLKTDMKFFREKTTENVVIMGRKTYQSIGGCLPNRMNVVLSHNGILFESTPLCQISLSIAEALYASAQHKGKEVFVVGGASTYEQFAPLVDRYLITIVDKFVEDADAFFSESVFGDEANWSRTLLSEKLVPDTHDEARFQIFEMLARDSDVRFKKRRKVMEEYASCIKPKPIAVPKRRNNNASSTATPELQLQL